MTVSGHRFDLDPRAVEAALQGALPEPIQEHFVVINGRRWPPKQVLALVTGLDRADFTTHQARRALTRLGFSCQTSGKPQGIPPSGLLSSRDSGANGFRYRRASGALGGGTAPLHRPVGGCPRR